MSANQSFERIFQLMLVTVIALLRIDKHFSSSSSSSSPFLAHYMVFNRVTVAGLSLQILPYKIMNHRLINLDEFHREKNYCHSHWDQLTHYLRTNELFGQRKILIGRTSNPIAADIWKMSNTLIEFYQNMVSECFCAGIEIDSLIWKFHFSVT